jgi:fructose-1,6-bisphosphatase II
VGPEARGSIDIDLSPTENLRNIADAKRVPIGELTVVILDRPRHEKLIEEVRQTGARIKLIKDGDVSAAIATCGRGSMVDVLMGIGGAPEGVIAAAALRCLGGEMQGRLRPRNEKEAARARAMGIEDIDAKLTIDDLASGDVMFAATGVTSGEFLQGVRFRTQGAVTHSVVMRSRTQTIRYIEAEHNFRHKPL